MDGGGTFLNTQLLAPTCTSSKQNSVDVSRVTLDCSFLKHDFSALPNSKGALPRHARHSTDSGPYPLTFAANRALIRLAVGTLNGQTQVSPCVGLTLEQGYSHEGFPLVGGGRPYSLRGVRDRGTSVPT